MAFTRKCFLGIRLGSVVGMEKGQGVGKCGGGNNTECQDGKVTVLVSTMSSFYIS